MTNFPLKYVLFLFYTLTIIALSSCFEDDVAIPFDAPAGRLHTIPLGNYYNDQVYYNLQNDSLVQIAPYASYDLQFECNDSGWHVFLNSAKLVLCWNTGSNNFDSVFNPANGIWGWDSSDGNADSTAIGNWFVDDNNLLGISKKEVYIIDRGRSQQGEEFGYKKLSIEGLQEQIYMIRYANMDGTDEVISYIEKDSSRNVIRFSFDDQTNILQEPEKDSWDILFSRYTYVFFQGDPDAPFTFIGDYLIYTVTGALINPFHTSVAEDFITEFDDISQVQIPNYSFDSRQDVIGWNWKTFSGSRYEVDATKNYIVKTQKNKLYKLRFRSFYNETGEKGYPEIETALMNY